MDPDADDALLDNFSGSSKSTSSSSSRRGGSRRAAATAAAKPSSKRAASPARRKLSSRSGGGGSGSGAYGQSGKDNAPSGGLSSRPPSTPLFGSPKAKTRTYGSVNSSRLSTESAAVGKRRVGFGVGRGAPRSGGGGGLSSGDEEERAHDYQGEGDADADGATEVEDEAAETVEAEGVATDVDCGRHSLGNSNSNNVNNHEKDKAAATAGDSGDDQAEATELDKTITAADGDDPAAGTELDKTITEDFFPDDAHNGRDRDSRSPAADGAERGAASPLSPSADAASTWTVGGRGLLGRGSARKNVRRSGLGSAGRVAAAGALKSPSLYVQGGGGSARGSRLARGRGGGGGEAVCFRCTCFFCSLHIIVVLSVVSCSRAEPFEAPGGKLLKFEGARLVCVRWAVAFRRMRGPSSLRCAPRSGQRESIDPSCIAASVPACDPRLCLV